MIFLITYDKNNLLKNYNPLYEEIKDCGTKWWHHMKNVWIIRTNLGANDIHNRLGRHIYQNDRLMIIELKAGMQMQGWLSEQAWKWIEDELYNDLINYK